MLNLTRRQGLVALTAAFVGVAIIAYLLVPASGDTNAAWIGIMAYLLVLGWAITRWQAFYILRLFHRLTDAERNFRLSLVPLAARAEILRTVNQHVGASTPPVERFEPHASVRNAALAAHRILVALTILTVGLLVLARLGAFSRASAVACLLAFAVGAAYYRRWYRLLEWSLEVSPFGLTMVSRDGTRRSLPWRGAAYLQPKKLPPRVEILTVDRAPAIIVPLDLSRSGEAIQRIIEFGDFVPIADTPNNDGSSSGAT